MKSSDIFSKEIDSFYEKEVETFLKEVPYAGHLSCESAALNEAYYLRHRVETVKRIIMTSKTDALALAKMIEENYSYARKWALYTVQEMNHDLMFMQDLKQHGYSEESVRKTKPFYSTIKLGEYLERKIEQHGSLPAVIYSLFVEWNSDKYSEKTVAKAENQFSRKHVKGSKAHIAFDLKNDHYPIILDLAYQLSRGKEKLLFEISSDIASLFREYFLNLYEETVMPEVKESTQ